MGLHMSTRTAVLLGQHTECVQSVSPAPQASYALLKYQVLARYLDTARLHGVMRQLGYSNAWIVLLPCVLAACAGLAPQLQAMVLSRARAERRQQAEQVTIEQLTYLILSTRTYD